MSSTTTTTTKSRAERLAMEDKQIQEFLANNHPMEQNIGNDKQTTETMNINKQVEQVEELDKPDPDACLFVASLNAALSEDELACSVQTHFQPFGHLVNVKVLKDWANRPYAFVQFQNARNAEKAMRELQHSQLDNRQIRIERAHVNRTLFIGKFSQLAGENELSDILSQYGEIEELNLLRDNQTQESKGSAFVKFRYREDAMNAYQNLRSRSKWVVEWATNKVDRSPTAEPATVFVGNLNPDIVNEKLLREKFAPFGFIEGLELQSKTYKSNTYAYAFIRYSSDREAHNAIKTLNDSDWLDRKIRVQEKETNMNRSRRHTAPAAFSIGKRRVRSGTAGSGWAVTMPEWQFMQIPSPVKPTTDQIAIPPTLATTTATSTSTVDQKQNIDIITQTVHIEEQIQNLSMHESQQQSPATPVTEKKVEEQQNSNTMQLPQLQNLQPMAMPMYPSYYPSMENQFIYIPVQFAPPPSPQQPHQQPQPNQPGAPAIPAMYMYQPPPPPSPPNSQPPSPTPTQHQHQQQYYPNLYHFPPATAATAAYTYMPPTPGGEYGDMVNTFDYSGWMDPELFQEQHKQHQQ